MTKNTVPCEECGEPVEVHEMRHNECTDWEIPDFADQEIVKTVPVPELEDLVAEMRTNIDYLEDIGTPQALGAKREREKWANELEELIE